MDKISPNFSEDILKVAIAKEHGISPEDILIEGGVKFDGTQKGHGCVCEVTALMFTAVIEGKRHEKNYIIKYAPDGQRGVFVKELKAFSQEAAAYNFLIPRLEQLRAEKGLAHLSFPKCFFASSEKEIIIMENLKAKNFQDVKKKIEPLSVDAIKLVLQELAKLHATGYFWINSGGDEARHEAVEAFGEDFFDPPVLKFFSFFEQKFVTALMVVERYGSPELSKRLNDYLLKYKEDVRAVFRNRGLLRLLTHGDVWYGNLLFSFPDDDRINPDAVVMFDLQDTLTGRLGVELNYFLSSCSSPRQRKQHFQEFLRLYYDTFFNELKALGDLSEPFFTLKDLVDEFNACYPYGFVMACGQAQGLLLDNDSGINLEDFGDKDASSNLQNIILKHAENSTEFRELILSLAQEAAEKNLI